MSGAQRSEDERGFFARTWCREEFARHCIPVDMVQTSISRNRRAGTLRGLHFAWPPSREAKLVRCERGRVFDVILDLRPESPSFLQHFAVVLDADRAMVRVLRPWDGTVASRSLDKSPCAESMYMLMLLKLDLQPMLSPVGTRISSYGFVLAPT